MSVIILAAAAVCAQASSGAATASTATKQPAATTTQSPGSVAQSVSASNAGTGETTRKRIERARALAAAHQLSSAAGELESIRAQVKDDVVRNLASVMLIGIYLEDGNYARAESLLEEAFKECSSQHEVAVRVYFALAGQAVNGARSHVARYRTFGLDIGNAELPAEATGDLDRLRSFLERVLAQAKDLMKAN